jgi:hypothetical protein
MAQSKPIAADLQARNGLPQVPPHPLKSSQSSLLHLQRRTAAVTVQGNQPTCSTHENTQILFICSGFHDLFIPAQAYGR